MTWQDELQQLDAEFEAGRISAEEHRRRREALLGTADDAVQSDEQGASAPPEHAQHSSAGVAQEPAAGKVDPFPPPFTWPGSNRSGQDRGAGQGRSGEQGRNGEQGRSEQPQQHDPAQSQPQQPAQSQSQQPQHSGQPMQPQPAQPQQGQQSAPQQSAPQQVEQSQNGPSQPAQPQQGQQPLSEQATEQNAPVSRAAQLPPEMGRAQSPADTNSTQFVDQQQLGQVQAAQQAQQQPPQFAPQAQPQPPGTTGQPQQPVQQPWPQQPWGTQQPQQNWGVDTAGTPWGNAEIPPPDGGAPWLRNIPGGFDEPIERKPKRGKLYAWLSVTGVLVVVAAIAVVTLLVPLGGGDEQAQPQPTSQPAPPPPSPTTSSLPEPPAPKPAPPASDQVLIPAPEPPHPWVGGLDRRAWASPKGQLLKPRPVRDFALDNGLRGGWFAGNGGPGPRVTMLALRMPNERTAGSVADRYLQAQQELSPVDELSYRGVEVLGGDTTYRTAYAAHDWAVIVAVSAKPDQRKQADSLFSRVLDAQLAKTPPTVRD
ncbi:hypothetical protein [Bounagaea algeriensis]